MNEPATPASASTHPALRRRPAGVTLVALGAAFLALALLFGAGVWFGVTQDSGRNLIVRAGRLIALAMAVVAVLELVLAYGLWALRRWAWPFGVILLAVSIGLTILGGGRGDPNIHLVSLVVEIGSLWYLLGQRAREAFRADA